MDDKDTNSIINHLGETLKLMQEYNDKAKELGIIMEGKENG